MPRSNIGQIRKEIVSVLIRVIISTSVTVVIGKRAIYGTSGRISRIISHTMSEWINAFGVLILKGFVVVFDHRFTVKASTGLACRLLGHIPGDGRSSCIAVVAFTACNIDDCGKRPLCITSIPCPTRRVVMSCCGNFRRRRVDIVAFRAMTTCGVTRGGTSGIDFCICHFRMPSF